MFALNLLTIIFLQILLFVIAFVNCKKRAISSGIININSQGVEEAELQLFLEEVLVKNLEPYKCVVVITDDIYSNVFKKTWFTRFSLFITFIMINVPDYEDLFSPSQEIQISLISAKFEGCQMYIILLSNGVQVARLLRFVDRYRVIDTRAKFIISYDNRLFEKELFYVWKKIINVIFIRQYGGKRFSSPEKSIPWLEITTVPFPSPIVSILVPRRLDIWTNSRFRKGVDLYRDKTSDLRSQTLRIAAFAHIPGTVKHFLNESKDVRMIELKSINNSGGIVKFSGVEIEILKTISDAMNFQCELYEPPNIDVELLGGKRTGLIGEMVKTKADLAVGDLYYTPSIYDLIDLSVPYNTECLTFLTPESLTDNSWKTLILPFSGIMWACVIICLIICGLVFHALAKFYENIHEYRNKQKRRNLKIVKKKMIMTLSLHPEVDRLDSNLKYTLMKDQFNLHTFEGEAMGLYQFSEIFNSFLYTYSMLLLVSLPKLPTGWSLRMLTGWYWLYCLLLVVAYRASMTAILSRPIPRVTIDTLSELMYSKLPCGGLGDINRDFFKNSLDATIKSLGEKFETLNNSDAAVDRVAEGVFAFYENSYFLKEAIVKRQLRYQLLHSDFSSNETQELREIARQDRNLHIMTDCVIKMPISIGLQKNSPIKPRVDNIIRRVLEAGLIKKWLDDVMVKIINAAESQSDDGGSKAIMSMTKFFGALVALFSGYFISIVALVVEIGYFHFVVKKDPNYNKYSGVIEIVKKVD